MFINDDMTCTHILYNHNHFWGLADKTLIQFWLWLDLSRYILYEFMLLNRSIRIGKYIRQLWLYKHYQNITIV